LQHWIPSKQQQQQQQQRNKQNSSSPTKQIKKYEKMITIKTNNMLHMYNLTLRRVRVIMVAVEKQ